MIYSVIFFQCTVFIASYVHCAREPPGYFFNEYKEQNCMKLDHVFSHVHYWAETIKLQVDMICEADDVYALASFGSPEPTVIRARKTSILIGKVHHEVTVITFESQLNSGQATLYFKSVQDAKRFNLMVYPILRSNMKFMQSIGKIDEIRTTQPYRSPVAAHFADIYYEEAKGQNPSKFVIEADGFAEPTLVFLGEEFLITASGRVGSRFLVQMKFLGGTYEVDFPDAEKGELFVGQMRKYADAGTRVTTAIPPKRRS